MRALRIGMGHVLACCSFALVLVAFVITPGELAAGGSDVLAQASFLWLASAVQVAIFALPFVVLAVCFAEWRGLRRWGFYVVTALLIAAAGFLAQYASELQGAPTIANAYALLAFMMGAALAGLVYWQIAGRYAGRRTETAPGAARATMSDVAPSDG